MVNNYGVGDVVAYKMYSGKVRRARVTEKSNDIKRGKPGFTGVDLDSKYGVWGFDEQVESVIEARRPMTCGKCGALVERPVHFQAADAVCECGYNFSWRK